MAIENRSNTARRQPMLKLASLLIVGSVGGLLGGGCGGGGTLFDAPPEEIPAGELAVTWSISSNGTAKTCAEVSGAFVEIEVVRQDTIGGQADSVPCNIGNTSFTVKEGLYTVLLNLTNANGDELKSVQHQDLNVQPGQTLTDNFVFDIANAQ